MHWTGEMASSGRVDTLVAANPDPISGQPDLKAATVSLRRFAVGWYGFAVSTAPIQPGTAYWAKTRVDGGWQVEMAGDSLPDDWVIAARRMFGLSGAEVASVIDRSRGLARVAFHQNGQLLAALFVSPTPVALSRSQLIGRLGQNGAQAALAGRTEAGRPDPGPTVCACLNVGRNTIRDAIQTGRALSVEALGVALGAGTSCGSCRPELAGLIGRYRIQEAAE
jgi:assimilatory nitrate reductase catalytic subunit